MPSLGEKISALRLERGLSIKGLAAEADVSHTTVLRLEQGGTPHPDSLRKMLVALHRETPLSETDVFELARGTRLSEGAILAHLHRIAPVTPMGAPPEAQPLEDWRRRCHSLVDRMLARAPSPHDVELALVAMVAAFEAQMPGGPEGPMLTRRGETRSVAPGVTERTDEHYSPRRAAGS